MTSVDDSQPQAQNTSMSLAVALTRVLQADLVPTSPQQAADLLGGVISLSRLLADAKKALTSYLEDEGAAVGERWAAVQNRPSWERSYDDEGLLVALGGDIVSGLMVAHSEGLIDLKWRWTDLQRFCRQQGVALKVHRPDDGGYKGAGTPHVVETLKPGYWTVEPAQDDE